MQYGKMKLKIRRCRPGSCVFQVNAGVSVAGVLCLSVRLYLLSACGSVIPEATAAVNTFHNPS